MNELTTQIAGLSPEQREVFLRRLRQLGLERESASPDAITPRPRDADAYPVSYSQERFWFLDQLVPGNPADHIPGTLRLTGPLDVDALERSLQEVAQRHEALRTAFVERDGRPMQVVLPSLTLPLPVLDLEFMPAAAREAEVVRLAREHHWQPFDLGQAPLLRLTLVRLAPENHVLLVTLHHIVADGWSLSLLLGEVVALYEAFRAGQPSPLPELPIQYVDFAIWQRQHLEKGGLAADLDYWTRQLGGELPVLEVPPDRPRPAVQGFEGSRRTFRLSNALSSRLAELNRSAGVTPFMTLLAAFMALLHRYTSQRDLLVGSPVANRNRAEVEKLIGFFLNMVVLRAGVEDDPAFRQFLGHVQETALDAFSHQDLPFEKLVERLQPERDPARTPLFQVMFVLQNVPLPRTRPGGLQLGRMDVEYGTSQYDLSLSMFETVEGLSGWFEYNTVLYDAATIHHLADGFETLLEEIVADPGRRVSSFLPLSGPARQQLLVEWNGDPAAVDDGAPFHRAFEAWAARCPEAPAVLSEDGTLAYGELDRRTNQLARHLRRLGVGPEVVVGVHMERRPELIVALLAIAKAGGVYLPLDCEYPEERVLYMLDDSRTRVLLTAGGTVGEGVGRAFSAPGRTLVRLDRNADAFAGLDGSALGGETSPDQLAYVIYTSGSTGGPKGVMVPHGALGNHLAWRRSHFGMGPGDRALQKTSIGFDTSLWELCEPLVTGAAIVLARPGGQRDSGYLVQTIRDYAVTAIDFVPSMLPFFLESEVAGCSSLRRVETGGELLTPELHRRMKERLGLHPHNGYGPTETCVNITLWHWQGEGEPGYVAIGRPVAGALLYVLGPDGRPTLLGLPGELYVGGPSLARGYLSNPATTTEKFVPDPFSGVPGARLYRTGDLVRYRADGVLEFVGRLDQQVKLRGFRIELGEIEEVLRRHPAVLDAVLTVRDDGAGGKLLAAYVVPAGEVAVAELQAHAGRGLPEYMVPGAWRLLPELPLTPSGKVDRRALPAPERRRDTGVDYVVPRTPVEEVLASLWAEILGRDRVGAEDHFFRLGGHSLLAIRLIARVRDAFQVEIPLRELFRQPTVAGLARVVAELKGHAAGPAELPPPIVPDPADRHEPFPLTDVQQAYWIGRSQAMDLGGVAAHSYLELEGTGWDLGRFQNALRKLIARHDMLRAIVERDGRQCILAEVPPYEVRILDLRHRATEEVEAGLLAVREEMSHQVMPTDRWPLFEVRASLLDGGRVRLHLSMDGLISDAWSGAILWREFARFYLDPELDLPPLELSFRDVVTAQAALRETPAYERSLAYWRERVRTLPPAPELPMLAAAPAGQPEFVRRQDLMDPAAWGAVKERATRFGLTPSVVVLSAFAEVLETWSRRADFTLNLTLFNRPPLHPQVNEIAGDFTSLTMLAVHNSSGGSFEERARRIQERLWEDLDHSQVSGVQVLRELARAQGEAPRALMPVVFTSTLNMTQAMESDGEAPAAEPRGEERIEMIYSISQTPQVSLDHQVAESDGQLVLTWDALEALFPPGLVDDMFRQYRRLLDRLAASDAAWSEPARSWVPEEQLALHERVNATHGPLPEALLHQPFLEQAALRPDAPAVISPEGVIAYGELHRRSLGLARRLREMGARPNRLVAVVMEKGWEQVVAVLAVLEAGAAYLPMDAAQPSERIRYLLADGEVEIALTQSRFAERIEWPEGVRTVSVDAEPPAASDLEALPPVQSPLDLAYVIYTSGSTGRPKGVMIDHRGALNTIVDLNRRFGIGPEDRVLALSALNFDLSVYDIFGVLAAGGAVVVPAAEARREPAVWAELLVRERVTLWNTVPALMEMQVEWLERHPDLRPEGLRLVWMSGDWIPLTLPDRIRALAPRAQVISMGGATEASIWSILYPIGAVDPAWKSIPYGKPMVNQTFHVLDGSLRPRPVWAPGDLYIGGVGLAQSYWHDEEKTAFSFVNHPVTGERLYRTGDLGRYLPDGNIEFLGREDLQVKVQGFRIELGEIEAALLAHPGVAAAVVAAVGERHANKRLVGYFVARPEEEPGSPPPTPEELRKFLQGKLPEHMIPGAFARLDRLPLTPNGKVDRGALPAVAAMPDPERPARPVSGAAEGVARRIAELIAEVLNVGEVDPEANLLEMGAASVDIVRIANRLEDEFGFRPRMDEMFRLSIQGAVADFYERHLEQGEVYGAGVAHASGSGWDSLLAAYPMLREPDERERFKRGQPGVRTDPGAAPAVVLSGPALDEDLKRLYLERRSRRAFSPEPLALTALGNLLSGLRQISLDGTPKYLYGSAGGLYPVQTYVSVKPGRVDGLEAGVYYHDPVEHRLVPVSPEARIGRSVYGWINQPIFDQAAFGIFLIARPAAILPLYGPQSRDYCLLEAGLMTQVLEGSAPRHGIGLCQVGGVELEGIRGAFRLDPDQEYLHGLLGGPLDRAEEEERQAEAEISDWEQGEL